MGVIDCEVKTSAFLALHGLTHDEVSDIDYVSQFTKGFCRF